MVIVIEVDKNWTVGVDRYPDGKIGGVRLGFFAVHAVMSDLDSFLWAGQKASTYERSH